MHSDYPNAPLTIDQQRFLEERSRLLDAALVRRFQAAHDQRSATEASQGQRPLEVILGDLLALPPSWVAAALQWNWLNTNDARSWQLAVTARQAKDAGDDKRADYWLKRLQAHAEGERRRFLRGIARGASRN